MSVALSPDRTGLTAASPPPLAPAPPSAYPVRAAFPPAGPTVHPATSPRRYGDYVLLEPLGKGGMSAVDLARRSVDGAGYVRFLVIKRILRRNTTDPTFVRMFMDEARINAELQHENIAQVYDFGERDGEWYLAMEYVPGVDLRRLQKAVAQQKEGGALLPPRISLRILHDVLSALQYAHNRVDTFGQPMRIVHRDVNPRNIMVSVRGEVKLIDFGVAKADNRQDQTTGQTIKGKFAYMAPEQIESPVPVDGRADLFAVGLCFQELLTGTHPFRHLSEIQIIHRLMSARIEPMPECRLHPDPTAVRQVRDRALAADPSQRYPDARSFQEDLVRLAAPIGGLASRAELGGFFRRSAPEAAGAIAQRLESWRHAKGPPSSPPMLAVPPDADLGDDTWASDMRTAEIPADLSASRSLSADSEATVADRSVGTAASVAATPLGPPAALADPTEQSASSVVLQVPPRRSTLPVVAAIVIGGGLGLTAIAVMAIVFLTMAAPRDRVVAAAPDSTAEAPAPSGSPGATPASPPPEAPGAPEAGTSGRADAPVRPDAQAEPARTTSTRPSPSRTAPEKSPSRAPPPEPPPAEPAPEPAAGSAEPDPSPTDAPTAAPAEPAPPPETAPATTGFVFATSRPSGLEVLFDGRSLGPTPLRNAVLPTGRHTLTFRDPQTGDTTTRTVEVRENQPSHVKVSP